MCRIIKEGEEKRNNINKEKREKLECSTTKSSSENERLLDRTKT